jgi:hypothetical protein
MAFLRVVVIALCPTTVSNVEGRYLRAETTKFSIKKGSYLVGAKIAHYLLAWKIMIGEIAECG